MPQLRLDPFSVSSTEPSRVRGALLDQRGRGFSQDYMAAPSTPIQGALALTEVKLQAVPDSFRLFRHDPSLPTSAVASVFIMC